MKSTEDVTDGVLRGARRFYERRRADQATSATYGYFTRHPVAPLNRKRLRILVDQVEQRSQELGRRLRVLDLACGGGLITCTIAALGHRSLGLDLSEEEIRLARAFADEENFEGTFVSADLLNEPAWEQKAEKILGGKPDLITLAYALHHLPEVETFVERLSRWLDPGAIVLINEENPKAPSFRFKHQIRTWIQKDTEVEAHRSFDGWRSLFQDAGFVVTESPVGADLVPVLGRVLPSRCWSLVFSARLGDRAS